ncbi:MAG: substrate-binding domain-containing protein [Actinobacteria bacterium]|nr:substrate-binding domain-containing protein [Actinomycetota bacterium]
MIARKLTRTLVAGAAAAAMLVLPLAGASNAQSYEPNMKIAMIPKLGNIGYFKVAWTGAQKACKELKYECKYLGPNEITAAAQVKLINSAVQQGYDAVLVAANDKDALVPALKNAMKRGVVVVTWDSDVSSAGRQLFVNQASSQGIAEGLLASTYELMGGKGDFAILSTTPDASNQNVWIDFMKQGLASNPKYKDMKLVTTVYGDDLPDKSTTETQGLLQKNPTVKVIVAPTSVGIVAAAKFVSSRPEYKGKVKVTGLGLPNDMRTYVTDGSGAQAALWDVPALGYLSVYAAADIKAGLVPLKNNKAVVGSTVPGGALGDKRKVIKGALGPEVVLGPALVFTEKNISQYKF